MKFFHGILNGFRQIWAHKVRSSLTILGIVLGVAATVAVAGLIQGMFTTSMAVFVEAGGLGMIWTWTVPAPLKQAYLAGMSPGQTLQDVRAIRETSSFTARVSPEANLEGAVITRKGRTSRVYAQGVTREYFTVNNHQVVQGRYICDLDVEEFTPVAVLGSTAVRDLFGTSENPLNQKITINGFQFKVVGLLKHYEVMKGTRNSVDWKNRVILLPVTTVQKRLSGNRRVNEINIKVADVSSLAVAAGQVSNTLFHTHHGIRDYRVETNERWQEAVQRVVRPYRFTLGGNVVISLLVAGVGIMNVMLASMHERIREIGLRKAMGARNWDIFTQFLGEAIILAVVGGFLGVLVGAYAVSLLQSASFVAGTGQPIFSVQAVTISFGFSLVVGILAGIYPAVRAARLDPIVALRYE